MQTQTVSLGQLKMFTDSTSHGDDSEQSPALQYSKSMSRFGFAHSVDPVKKQVASFKFGFGLNAASSELDKDEILVPMKV